MTKSIPPLDLLWLLIESPVSTTHVGAMLLFKKPPGRTSVVREIVDAYRGYRPVPPFNYVPDLVGGGAPIFGSSRTGTPCITCSTWRCRLEAHMRICCGSWPNCTNPCSTVIGRCSDAG